VNTPTRSDFARPSGRWKTFGLAFILTLAPMLTWALATPLMASPDEPAHAIRAAAVARGDLAGTPSVEKPGQLDALVPRWVSHANALTCFAFQPAISAACQPALEDDPNELVTAHTSTALNSPMFYLATGWPSLLVSGNVGFYLMRVVNAILTAGLLAFAFMAVRQFPRNRWSTLALTIAVTPMVLFLGGVLNPNAVEFAAAAALLATLILTFSQPSPGSLLWERGAIVILSTTLLTSTRNISFLWLVLASIIALFFAHRTILFRLLKRPALWLTLVIVAVTCGFALAWFTRRFTLSHDSTDLSFNTVFIGMVQRTLDQCNAWVGSFGWLDWPASSLSVAIWITAVFVMTTAALLFTRPSARVATVVVLLAIILVPALAQAAVASTVGYIWQGRYTLALFFFLMITCGAALDGTDALPASNRVKEWNRVLVATLMLIGIGHIATFVWVLERYVVGSTDLWQMVFHPLWQPRLTWEGLTLVFILVTAIGLRTSWRAIRFTSPIDTPTSITTSR